MKGRRNFLLIVTSLTTLLLILLQLKASLADAESAQLITPRQQNEDTTAVAASLGGDVQKKITPWSNPGSVVAELFPGSVNLASPVSSTRSLRCGEKREGGLILVASLLNKIPNLGGK